MVIRTWWLPSCTGRCLVGVAIDACGSADPILALTLRGSSSVLPFAARFRVVIRARWLRTDLREPIVHRL